MEHYRSVMCCLLVVSSAIAVGSAVRVGVVLDLTSEVGRESLACISTALDDFHRDHRPSGGATSPRVELRVWDSRGEVVTSAHAAKDLTSEVGRKSLACILTALDDFHRDHHPSGAATTRVELRVRDSRGEVVAAAHAEIEGKNERIIAGRNSGALTRGQKKLKIGVPQKHGFKAFVNASSQNVTGYCIDIFDAAVKKLPYDLDYEFIVYSGSYDQLVHSVSIGIFDAAVGDITITVERANKVDFTMPYYTESGLSLLVLTEDDPNPTIEWVFLKALTKELWLAIVGGFFFTGLVVWIFERPRSLEYQGSSWKQFSTALYFSFSTLTFSHGPIIKSSLSKTVVVIWCFVVLVLVQSYTASLSSILTTKRLRPAVTDLKRLRLNGDYVGYPFGSFVESILINQGFNTTRLRPYGTKEEYAIALRKGSKKGGVSAIVDEDPYLTLFLSDTQYRNEFQMVNRIYKTPGFGFVFPLGSPLVHDLSVAILNLTRGKEGSEIEAKWLGTAAPLPSNSIPNTDSTPLTLRNFSGLFIIFGCVSALMLLISIARSIHAKYTRVRDSDMNSNDESEGHGESSPLRNGVSNGPVSDQPLHEARNDDSQPVHGNGERARGEESSPIPNCINNGSAHAHSIQIVTNTV